MIYCNKRHVVPEQIFKSCWCCRIQHIGFYVFESPLAR